MDRLVTQELSELSTAALSSARDHLQAFYTQVGWMADASVETTIQAMTEELMYRDVVRNILVAAEEQARDLAARARVLGYLDGASQFLTRNPETAPDREAAPGLYTNESAELIRALRNRLTEAGAFLSDAQINTFVTVCWTNQYRSGFSAGSDQALALMHNERNFVTF